MYDARPYFEPIVRSTGFDPEPGNPTLVHHKERIAAAAPPPQQAPQEGSRLPPGQSKVCKLPVMDIGTRPLIATKDWTLTWGGLCDSPGKLDWGGFNRLGLEDRVNDIHCVTGWSRMDNRWRGVPFQAFVNLAGPKPGATHAIFKSHDGYGTALSLDDLVRPTVLLATEWDGKPLARDYGGPMRLVVPHLYFWKSAKWIKQIWFTEGYPGGYWENRGYHHRGDPWKQERYE